MDAVNNLGFNSASIRINAPNKMPDYTVKNDFSINSLGKDLNLSAIAQQQADQVIHPFNGEFLQPIAYRQEDEAGHGNLIIQDGATIQGYIADMPDNFNINENDKDKNCKLINEGLPKEAKVCVGSDNNIPEAGDVDFVAINDKWYKIRSGTAIVSKDSAGNTIIEPKGASIGSYGVSPNFDIDPNKSLKDNLAQSSSVVHEVNDNPLPWSNPPDSLEPAQYLNRLNNESGIGPLPVKPPVVLDNSI